MLAERPSRGVDRLTPPQTARARAVCPRYRAAVTEGLDAVLACAIIAWPSPFDHIARRARPGGRVVLIAPSSTDRRRCCDAFVPRRRVNAYMRTSRAARPARRGWSGWTGER